MIAVASVDPAAASRSFSEAQWPTRRLPIALVLLMCVIALARNYAIVREFDWPGFDIEFREMAAAQTLLDEGFGPDSSYQGERIWYNPLPAGVAAIGSRVTGVPLHKFIVRVGPWLNLLAPLALFWLVAVLFDAWCGVAATAAFLFMTGTNLPFYYSATYSPWFAPENFGQAPFYVALLPLSRSFNAPSSGWRDAGIGALLGVIFLCHTAPALLFGGILLVLTAVEVLDRRAIKPAALRLGRVLGVALLVSAPFLLQIIGVYHLRVVNTLPSASPSGILDPNEFPVLAAKLMRLPVIAAALYAIRLAVRRDRAAVLLLAWIGLAGSFIGYRYISAAAQHVGLTLPSIVPAYHFLFYSMAWVSIAFGCFICEAAAWLARVRGWHREAVIMAAVLGLVAVHVPSYLQRDDFTVIRAQARQTAGRLSVAGYEWVRAYATSDDVFLCTDGASLFLVAPAGGRVVATDQYFSNPFVDWRTRDRDRAAMFHALRTHDFALFDQLAAGYHVRFIVAPGSRLDSLDGQDSDLEFRFVPSELPSDRFRKAFQAEDLTIFEVRRPS